MPQQFEVNQRPENLKMLEKNKKIFKIINAREKQEIYLKLYRHKERLSEKIYSTGNNPKN